MHILFLEEYQSIFCYYKKYLRLSILWTKDVGYVAHSIGGCEF